MTEQPKGDPTSRRAVLLSAGAVGSAAVLAACGTDSPGTEAGATTAPAAPTSPPADPPTSSPAPGGATVLTPTADVPVGGGVIVADHGIVVTQPEKGTFKGFSNECTHQGCAVSSVDAGRIHCKCHNSAFSVADGSVKGGPAPQPLPAMAVKVQGANVVLG